MKSNFSIIVIVIFIAIAVFSVLVFAGVINIGNQEKKSKSLGTVTLWGTINSDTIAPLIQKFNDFNPNIRLRYAHKFPESFDKDLLEALASGEGPDLFFMPNDLALSYSNKIHTIPYTNYPIATFTSKFAGAGEVFLTSKGILALPITIDPLMMYYNRSILDAEDIVYPPNTWEELANLSTEITQRDESRQLIRSTVALGQFSNILNAKDIITTLFMQAGNKITQERDGGNYLSTLDETKGLEDILSFYTNFSNPLNETYSWNKSLPNSQSFFSSEKLVFYFGYASELRSLVNKNPNQNFLVTQVPQVKNSKFKLTNAKVTGVAVSSFSKNLQTAVLTADLMANGEFARDLATLLAIAPARRDLLNQRPTDAYFPHFYTSALIARSWLDPSPTDSNNVFRRIIDGVLSNSMTPYEAIGDADSKLQLLLRK